MKRLIALAKWLGFLILILPSLPHNGGAQQAFPVLLVDTAVRSRMAEEWEPDNRYQHERGYCFSYTTERKLTLQGYVVIYTLTSVERADEEGTTPVGIDTMSCPLPEPYVFGHIHPPLECAGHDDGTITCERGGKWAYQCFPSPPDMHTINRGSEPFEIIQCDRFALVPVWRTAPLPLDSSPGSHR